MMSVSASLRSLDPLLLFFGVGLRVGKGFRPWCAFLPAPIRPTLSENHLQDTFPYSHTSPSTPASVTTTLRQCLNSSPLQDKPEIVFVGLCLRSHPCSDSSSPLFYFPLLPCQFFWNISLISTATESSSQVSGSKEHDLTHSRGIL